MDIDVGHGYGYWYQKFPMAYWHWHWISISRMILIVEIDTDIKICIKCGDWFWHRIFYERCTCVLILILILILMIILKLISTYQYTYWYWYVYWYWCNVWLLVLVSALSLGIDMLRVVTLVLISILAIEQISNIDMGVVICINIEPLPQSRTHPQLGRSAGVCGCFPDASRIHSHCSLDSLQLLLYDSPPWFPPHDSPPVIPASWFILNVSSRMFLPPYFPLHVSSSMSPPPCSCLMIPPSWSPPMIAPTWSTLHESSSTLAHQWLLSRDSSSSIPPSRWQQNRVWGFVLMSCLMFTCSVTVVQCKGSSRDLSDRASPISCVLCWRWPYCFLCRVCLCFLFWCLLCVCVLFAVLLLALGSPAWPCHFMALYRHMA